MIPSNLKDPSKSINSVYPSISNRALNVCRRNQIDTIGDLINYYKTNQNFIKLDSAGVKTSDELVSFIETHYSIETSKLFDNEHGGDITIGKMLKGGTISARAYNALDAKGLNSLSRVYSYFTRKKHFLGLKQIGKRTNTELCDLCNNISHSEVKIIDKNLELKFKHPLLEYWEDADEYLKEVLNHHFLKSITKLSVRGLNAIKRILHEKKYRIVDRFQFEHFLNYCYEINFHFEADHNIGRKTSLEITNFIEKMDSFARNYILQPSEKFDYEVACIRIENQLSESGCTDTNKIFVMLSSYQKEYIQHKFPAVKVASQIIEDSNYLESREKLILNGRVGYFLNKEKCTLKEIANREGVTRERIRQIQASGKVESKVSSLIRLILDTVGRDNVNNNEYFNNKQSPLPVGLINEKEGVDMSRKFYELFRELYCEVP